MNWKTAGKIAVTSGLMLYLISKLDITAIYETFTQMDLALLSLSIPFIALMYTIKARKWQILLNCINVQISIRQSLKIILIGTFYGALTPGRAGEVSRAFYIDTEKSRSIPTVIMDRVIDIVCLLALSVLSTALFFKDRNLIYLMVLVVLLFIAGIIIITNERVITLVFKSFSQRKEHKENYIKTIKEITGNRKALFFVFSLTLGYYILNLIVYWIVIKSLSPALNNILTFSLPIIVILGNIPISISGFGVREFASVTIFRMLNENSAYGFSCPLVLYFMTSLSPALFGFLLTLRKKS
ncbi:MULTISPECIES: lysylphosphatidylglycerol synthase transmembrane domain-containing protein [unclassified Methanosarcina]|uniref:lysylphosphatidylglycerol synthase transmembrane domain-containing protein n=1 Tax=unclassified Methanosarcina TaxID=2644672 RepID=UPI00064E9DF3|nr:MULTISPECIES: lysylphosphatidylglycerol synthase transmembrane domain-containing protein [unclassified Methanosarcina]